MRDHSAGSWLQHCPVAKGYVTAGRWGGRGQLGASLHLALQLPVKLSLFQTLVLKKKKKKLYWGPATLACYTGFFSKSTQEKLRGWALGQDMAPTFPLGPSTAHTTLLVTQGENCPWTPGLFTVTGHTEKSFHLRGGWGETAELTAAQPGAQWAVPSQVSHSSVLPQLQDRQY